jgi:hypothetical protein
MRTIFADLRGVVLRNGGGVDWNCSLGVQISVPSPSPKSMRWAAALHLRFHQHVMRHQVRRASGRPLEIETMVPPLLLSNIKHDDPMKQNHQN